MRYAHCLPWIPAGLATVAIGYTLGTALDRRPPVLEASIEGRLDAEVYAPGTDINGSWRMTAIRVCDSDRLRWLEVPAGGDRSYRWVYPLPTVPMPLSLYADRIPGTIDVTITTFKLPPDAPAGPAEYHALARFRCAWPGTSLFPIEVVFKPVRFTISANEPAPTGAGPH